METETYSFKKSYGSFTENLSFGELNLSMKLAHHKTVWVKLNGDNELIMQISCITGTTPKTYYSGNRKYGKYVFVVPKNIKVIKNEFSGSSNDEAFSNNTSLLKGGTHGAGSFGFDFFKIIKIGNEEISMEVSEKITKLEFHDFGDLEEEVFFANAMPYNLSEIFNDFPYQTSGWRSNSSETHLHAVIRIKDIHCFIPFAANSQEIDVLENCETTYLKCIKEAETVEEAF
jgi:hypothetical protein